MTDSSEENEKLQYVKKDLFQPGIRPWHRRNGDTDEEKLTDDDSNNLFMSEPSMSEVDDSSDQGHNLRLLSPAGSFTEDEEQDIDFLPPPPPPSGRLLTAQSAQAPMSPGNTSISSWESPHFNRRIQVHFSPDRKRKGVVKVDTGNETPRLIMRQAAATKTQFEDGPPANGSRTLDRGFGSDNQQSSSSSPVSERHRRRLEEFLHDLRINSQGQVQESAVGADTSFESSYQIPNTKKPQFIIRPKNNDGIPQHERISSLDTAVVQNTSVSEVPLPAPSHDTQVNPTDDTIVMVLSDSEDEGKETNTGSSSSRPLDWEQKDSADDEKTADRPRRVRGKLVHRRQKSGDAGKPGHRRQRSGDAAAAKMSTGRSDWKGMGDSGKPGHRRQRSGDVAAAKMSTGRSDWKGISDTGKPGHRRQRSGDVAAAKMSTGRSDWKGMDKDKIPLPPVPGEQDETDFDEEDGKKAILRDEERDAGSSSNDQDPYKSTISALEGGLAGAFRKNSKEAGEIAQFSKFALGTAGNETSSSRRPYRRQQRRDSRSRRKVGVVESFDDSSSYASTGPSPRGDVNFQAPYAFRPGSVPSPTFSGYSASPQPAFWTQHNRTNSHPIPSPASFYSDYTDESPRSQQPNWSPQWNLSLREPPKQGTFFSPQWYRPVSENGTGRHHRSESDGARSAIDRMGSQCLGGSLSSNFSWISGKRGSGNDGKQQQFGSESEMSPLWTNKTSENLDDDQGPNDDYSNSSSRSRSTSSLDRSGNFGVQFQTPQVGTAQTQNRRGFPSPFESIGKTVEKFDRSRFLPHTSAVGEDENAHQTYICPVCKTRQREFFSVANAPSQFESASGYLALYFGIYVIVALYIFGLQEGWSKLDCIYFAGKKFQVILYLWCDFPPCAHAYLFWFQTVITLTTAGLGDFVPTSDSAKVMCSIFIYFGVACIGLLLGSYIAGMLDESSSRAARANRIKSCPNCARIQSINEAAERRRGEERKKPSRFQPKGQNYDMFEKDPKKIKRRHMNTNTVNRTSYNQETPSFKMTPGTNDLERSEASHSSHGSQVDTINSPFYGHSPNTHLSPLPSNQSKNVVGSPLTTQILGRQSHTRHASLDLNRSTTFSGVFGQRTASERRKYSADLPATIEENDGFQEKNAAPPPPKLNASTYDDDASDDDDDDDTTSDSGESSSSSEDTADEFESQYSGVKNAKYVFLTLREALVNSMVIIAFGCMGFFFIEGFSIVDSWYFTTVLLTTGELMFSEPYCRPTNISLYDVMFCTILLQSVTEILFHTQRAANSSQRFISLWLEQFC